MEPSKKGIYEYLTEYGTDCPEKVLLRSEERAVTARQALELVRGTAGKLAGLGIRRGNFVALRATRSTEAVLLFLSLQALGAVAVLTDPYISVDNFLAQSAVPLPVEYAVTNEAAAGGICAEGDWQFRDVSRGTEQPLTLEPGERLETSVCVDEPAVVIFTSGSTGKCKAVVLSQCNYVNNLVDSQPLGWYLPEDVAMGLLPIHHVFGLALMVGAVVLQHCLFLPQTTDVPHILSCVERYGVTRINGVPSLYLAMLEQRGDHDLTSLRTGFVAGAPCSAGQFVAIEEGLGMTLISVYGMSECIGITCSSYRDSRQQRAGGVGPFYPMNDGRILNDEGEEVPRGQEGEICVNGPVRMLGYYGSSEGIDSRGYLHTGDLGYVDEIGVVHITGRKKDIIIRNGNNLSPRRIEEALLALPQVGDAVVVGLPDQQTGEAPYAAVVCREAVTSEKLLEALAGLLAKNELPKVIRQVDTIPLTGTGKPDKIRIREEMAAWLKA